MPIRSMTGFAQVKGLVSNLAFSLSIKSVNHRFLDLHFRLPSYSDALEMALRRVLKEKLARGHVDVNLSFDQGAGAMALNRPLVSAYVQAFRAAADVGTWAHDWANGAAAGVAPEAVRALPACLVVAVADAAIRSTAAAAPARSQRRLCIDVPSV